jgi:hypothetical protein
MAIIPEEQRPKGASVFIPEDRELHAAWKELSRDERRLAEYSVYRHAPGAYSIDNACHWILSPPACCRINIFCVCVFFTREIQPAKFPDQQAAWKVQPGRMAAVLAVAVREVYAARREVYATVWQVLCAARLAGRRRPSGRSPRAVRQLCAGRPAPTRRPTRTSSGAYAHAVEHARDHAVLTR